MQRIALASVLGLLLILARSSTALAQPKIGELIMDGHDRATIRYADRCSNGANSTAADRDRYVTALRADPKSKLSIAMAKLAKRLIKPAPDLPTYEIALGDWVLTYHLRMGCAETKISWSAPVFLASTMSNEHEQITKMLVTIDDDTEADVRTFKLRSIAPLALRDR